MQVRFVTSEGREVECSLAEADARTIAQGRPVRIPPSYAGQGHYPGLFYSTTNSDLVVYESRLELAWLWLADFDQSIVRLSAQPFELSGLDGNRTRTRFPDFLWIGADGRLGVIDVKPASMLDEPEVRAALNWTAHALQARGWPYQVWHGASLIELRNVRLIAAGRLPGLVSSTVVRATVDACPGAGTTVGLLERQLLVDGVTATARAAIFAALWWGHISCDLSKPLDQATWVVRV